MNKDDPINPEVIVQGYGRLSMNGLKRDVTDMLTGLAEFAERDDWETNMKLKRYIYTKTKCFSKSIGRFRTLALKGRTNRGINQEVTTCLRRKLTTIYEDPPEQIKTLEKEKVDY